MGQGFGHVAAAIAEADVAGLVVDGAGQEKNTGLLDEAFAEGLDVLLRLEAREADGAGVGRSPIEKIRVAREESGKLWKIAKDDLEVAVDEFLAMAEGEGGEELAGSAGADGGVVLEAR